MKRIFLGLESSQVSLSMKPHSVLCEIRSSFEYVQQIKFSRSLSPQKFRFDPRTVHVRLVVNRVINGHALLQLINFPIFIIGRAKGQSLRTFKTMHFRIYGSIVWIRNFTFLVFKSFITVLRSSFAPNNTRKFYYIFHEHNVKR